MGYFRYLGCALLGLGPAASMAEDQPAPDWRLLRLEARQMLAPGTPVRISNPYGDVRLRPLTGALEVSAQTQIRLPQTCTPALQLTPEGAGVRLDAVCPPDAQGLLRLDMTVFVPADTPLTVQTSQGFLEARGLTGLTAWSQTGNIRYRGPGPLVAFTERGSILATFTRTAWDAAAWPMPSELHTLTGNITTQLRGQPPVCLELATSGVLSTDYSLNVQQDPHGPPKQAYAQLQATCQAWLLLDSHKGDIRLIRLPEVP